MEIRETEITGPGPGEVPVEQTAIGFNYMYVYQRSGHYPQDLPSGLGLEAAGRVLEVGEGVADVKVDDRIAYGPVLGAYARHRNVPAARVVPIPDDISDDTAAAVLMKGMTVEYLMCRAYPVKAGEDVLFMQRLAASATWPASGANYRQPDDRRHLGRNQYCRGCCTRICRRN